jgi:hypothetical protein
LKVTVRLGLFLAGTDHCGVNIVRHLVPIDLHGKRRKLVSLYIYMRE